MLPFLQIDLYVPGQEAAAMGISSVLFLNFAYILAGLILVGLIYVVIKLILAPLRAAHQTSTAFNKVTLLVTVPKQEKGRQKEDRLPKQQEIQEDIGVMETFFSTLGGLKAQRTLKSRILDRDDHLSFEIVANNGVIAFYVATPRYMRRFIEEQVQAQFPGAVVEEVEDYNIFKPTGFAAGAYVTFRRPFYFPIKTYRKLDSDPLNSITNALSKITANEGALIQFVVRSAKKEWHRPGPKIAREMQQGAKYDSAVKKVSAGPVMKALSAIIDLFTAGGLTASNKDKPKDPKKDYKLSPLEEEVVKGLEEKSSKAGLDCNIRVIVSAATKELAEAKVDDIINAFNQYNIYEYGNGFNKTRAKNLTKFLNDSIYRHYHNKYRTLLNSEEMASLYHFPLPTTETPNILWLSARKAPAPVNTPKEGIILGRNVYRNVETLVRLKEADRGRHAYIIGMTGSGKSVLMENMAIQDIKNGNGVCVIDPHGDLVQRLLGHVPKDRVDDVIYFDPSDFERPIALNLLEFDKPEQKGFLINEMINIFDKLYDLRQTGGPMFEQYMRNTMLLMMEDPDSGSTLLEVSKVLADPDFRAYKLSKSKNPVVNDFWQKEAEKAGGEAALANMVPYITSKLTPFIANDLIRPIIAQQKSAIDFRKAMDNKQILLINLSKGKIGDINANLLGMVIIGKILIAALSRAELPEEDRSDFYLYVDEFQNFLTDSISIILSEARKYKLNLVIAHQFIGQLVKNNDTRIRDSVFGNVGTQIAFRIGADDAEFMAKQFAPTFNEHDLINIPKYNAYTRLLIDNENPPPFNILPFPPSEGDAQLRDAVKQLSRLKYGRDRRIVEAEIAERATLGTAASEQDNEDEKDLPGKDN